MISTRIFGRAADCETWAEWRGPKVALNGCHNERPWHRKQRSPMKINALRITTPAIPRQSDRTEGFCGDQIIAAARTSREPVTKHPKATIRSFAACRCCGGVPIAEQAWKKRSQKPVASNSNGCSRKLSMPPILPRMKKPATRGGRIKKAPCEQSRRSLVVFIH